jgi:hypothetical protein
MDARTTGMWTAAVGAAAQIGGLGVDAWLHARDPDLAAREGVFTLTNVGHSLLIAGFVLTVAGLVLALTRGRWVASLATVGAFAIVVPLAATSSLGEGHDHAAGGAHEHDGGHDHGRSGTETAHDHEPGDQELAAAAAIGGGAADHDHGHGAVVPEQPLDPATRDALGAQLTTAREVALRFPTVADAEAEGYRMVTPYVPLIGAHYIRFSLMDGSFDVEGPEMLLYDGTAPDSGIVGLSYYVVSRTGAPEGFVGPNDHWHQHIGLCINRDLVVVGGEDTTEEECAARGGMKVDGSDGWMVHAWVVPGWESPQGVFSPEHAGLV